MKIYNTQQEVEKDIKDGVLEINGDVKFECSITINASIRVIAGDINAHNINAHNINAHNINAHNIVAYNIIAARNIVAHNINAAHNIVACNIVACDVLYYAFCCVYQSIKCLSIKAKREKHQEPICLDGCLEIIKEETQEVTMAEVCEKFGKKVKIIKEK